MFPRKLKAVHPMETVMKEMSRSENMEALKEKKEDETAGVMMLANLLAEGK